MRIVNEILALFDRTGAYLRGHFRLTSGLIALSTCSARWCCNIRSHAEDLGSQLARNVGTVDPGSADQTVVVACDRRSDHRP